MATNVEFRGVRDMISTLNGLERKAAPRAMSRALNRTATHTRKNAVSEIATLMGIGRKTAVRDEIKIVPATINKLSARLTSSYQPLNLINFRARQTKKGVTASAWGKRKLYKSAFIQTMPKAGKKLVMKRKGKPRLPLQQLYGPSVSNTLAEVSGKVSEDGLTFLRKRFKTELDFEVSKLRKKL